MQQEQHWWGWRLVQLCKGKDGHGDWGMTQLRAVPFGTRDTDPGSAIPGADAEAALTSCNCILAPAKQAARIHQRAKTQGQVQLAAPSLRAAPLKREQAAQSPPAGSLEKQREQVNGGST